MRRVMESRDFISCVISDNILDEAIAWIASNLNPEDVFTEDMLDEWAEDNGYMKIEQV